MRKAVETFAGAMESRLKANDHKGGWGEAQCTLEYLEYRLIEEVGEYFAQRARGGMEGYFNIEPELLDIANFAMMLYHRMLDNENCWG